MSEVIVKFPVFVAPEGERFVFPGLFSTSDGEVNYSWEQCRKICLALGVTEEKEPLIVPVIDDSLTFPRVIATMTGRGLMHGRTEVWMISGPTFDEFVAKMEITK